MRRSDLVFFLLFAFALYAAWIVRHALLLIYVGMIFAVIFMPVVRKIQQVWIRGWHPGRGAAILALLTGVLAVLAVVLIFMVPRIADDAQELTQDLPEQLRQLSRRLQSLPLGHKIAARLNPDHIGRYLGDLLQHSFRIAKTLAGGLLDLLMLGLMTVYFILDGNRSLRWATSLFPAEQQPRLRKTLANAGERAQRWLTGQLLLMLILGISSAVVFGFLHVRYFYALAVFAGVANFIPVAGPIATVVVAGGVAVLDSWSKLLGVVIFYLVYQQVENAYLTPRIMKAQVGLPGVAVIVALVTGAALAGLLGAIVAVPTAAMLATVLDEYAVKERHA